MPKRKKKNYNNSFEYAAQSGAAYKIVEKYGSASKEHLVAYSGQDNEHGCTLKRGLKKTSESKVNPDYRDQNLKQQAGFAAEDKYTARQNAEKIIKGDKTRISRTDDLGRVNDPLYDHVLLDSDGIEIPGTGEQMKFVGSNPKECLKKLESEKFQKYLDANATITVPSDFYEGIIVEADKEIASFKEQLSRAKQNKDLQLASSIEKRIEKVKKIKDSVKDSGITNEEALYARQHPKLSTAKDIVKISHRAGLEQVKYGVAISGGISLIKNVVAVTKGKKSAKDAAIAVAVDSGKGAVTAYTTAFAGSAIKAGMQNSKSSLVRTLSKSNAPAMIVTSTIDISKSMTRYFKGEISGTDCLLEVGEKGTSNIGAAMFTVVGQAAIPIPIVGALVGSMVGYAMTSAFYGNLTEALKEAKISHENRIKIEKECEEAISMIHQYRSEINTYVQKYLNNYNNIFNDAFIQLDNAFLNNDINEFIGGANKITRALGGIEQFSNMSEFNSLMNSSNNFNL
jgi:hypothetical protein